MGFRWITPPRKALVKYAEDYTSAVMDSGRKIAYIQAERIEQWMQQNAPWTDRTGRARKGLRAWVREIGPVGSIIISHDPNLDYTIWLEVANQGRYSIIDPTLDYWTPQVQKSLNNMARLGIITIDS